MWWPGNEKFKFIHFFVFLEYFVVTNQYDSTINQRDSVKSKYFAIFFCSNSVNIEELTAAAAGAWI